MTSGGPVWWVDSRWTAGVDVNDNTWIVVSKGGAVGLRFSPAFNAAVPLAHRHVHQERGDAVAIHAPDGEAITYRVLEDRSNRAGNALLTLGLRPGDRIPLVMETSPALFYLFIGAVRIGALPAILAPNREAPLYRAAIDEASASFIAHDHLAASVLDEALAGRDGTGPMRLSVEDSGAEGLAARMEAASAEIRSHRTGSDDPCFSVHGATGSRTFPHGHMATRAELFGVERFQLGSRDRFLSTVALDVEGGLDAALGTSLCLGAAAIIAPTGSRATPAATLALIEAQRPTVYLGEAQQFEALLALLEAREDPAPLSSLRCAVCVGAPPEGDLEARWTARTGLALHR